MGCGRLHRIGSLRTGTRSILDHRSFRAHAFHLEAPVTAEEILERIDRAHMLYITFPCRLRKRGFKVGMLSDDSLDARYKVNNGKGITFDLSHPRHRDRLLALLQDALTFEPEVRFREFKGERK